MNRQPKIADTTMVAPATNHVVTDARAVPDGTGSATTVVSAIDAADGAAR